MKFLESSFAEENLRVPVDSKLNMSQWCALAAKVANCVLDYISNSEARGMILSLSLALVRCHVEYCTQSTALQYRRDMEIPEPSPMDSQYCG